MEHNDRASNDFKSNNLSETINNMIKVSKAMKNTLFDHLCFLIEIEAFGSLNNFKAYFA